MRINRKYEGGADVFKTTGGLDALRSTAREAHERTPATCRNLGKNLENFHVPSPLLSHVLEHKFCNRSVAKAGTMAAASDKARFYLEQYVPELQEYERKQIFSRDEISAITSKRSDFEHTLNARGSRPEDYLQYVAYEMNLDRLRKIRCHRKGVKSTAFSGQRTIFFIFDRATKKFPGAIDLWIRYIEYCKKEKASKKLGKIFTSVLRLHPRNWSFWVLAAKYYAEAQGDMATARAYLQRGLRFCPDSRKLYLEYTKLEMVYLAKLAARRKILGLDESREKEKVQDGDDMITLPTVTAEEFNAEARHGVEQFNASALKKLETAPAYTGAIPIAIFDAAMQQFTSDAADVAEDFVELVAQFELVPSAKQILDHILASLPSTEPPAVGAIMCRFRMLLFGVATDSEEFPVVLSQLLAQVKAYMGKLPAPQQHMLALRTIPVLLTFLRSPENVDEDVLKVLEASIVRYLRSTKANVVKTTSAGPTTHEALVQSLRENGHAVDATNLQSIITEAGLG